jgi:carbonic anhydrase
LRLSSAARHSRVPPELIFDVGLRDIFVVRTAGEVVDAVAIGSIHYAVAHLGTNLIVVPGHESAERLRPQFRTPKNPEIFLMY